MSFRLIFNDCCVEVITIAISGNDNCNNRVLTKGIVYNRLALIKCYLLDMNLAFYAIWLPS